MDPSTFFNSNPDHYGTLTLRDWDHYFLDVMLKRAEKPDPKILDIGGGGGAFAKLCQDQLPESRILVVDPAEKLMEKQDLEGIDYQYGRLPDEIRVDDRFDFVHIKEVLHHVTGPNVRATESILRDSITTSKELLAPGGYLLIHEIYYESFLYPKLTSTAIFYALRLQNHLNVKLPTEHFKLGLDVFFYTRRELEEAIAECGLRIVEKRDDYDNYNPNPLMKSLLFLKEWGRVCFVLQKA